MRLRSRIVSILPRGVPMAVKAPETLQKYVIDHFSVVSGYLEENYLILTFALSLALGGNISEFGTVFCTFARATY